MATRIVNVKVQPHAGSKGVFRFTYTVDSERGRRLLTVLGTSADEALQALADDLMVDVSELEGRKPE